MRQNLSDVGTRPDPTFVDIDGDNDLDAFVGEFQGSTKFFENTGTTNNPVFSAPITNPFGLNSLLNSSPTFVDIDGDGDLDAFAGGGYRYSDSGDTLFYENTGTNNNPAFSVAAAIINPFGLSNVGDSASPALVDIDGDDDLDAFVSNATGDTLFFSNVGTINNPVFCSPITNPFGLSNVGSRANPTFVDIDKDGDLDAFAGANNTEFYWNTGTTSSPMFSYGGHGPFGLPAVGGRDRINDITFADIDGDLDAYVAGGYLYASGYPSTTFFINNNAPNVTNLNASEAYTVNTSLNLTDIVVSDGDSTNITAILTLSNIAAGSLSTATSGTVTSIYNVGTGEWTASGALADVNTLLANAVFTPTIGFNSAFSIATSISDGVASPLIGSKSFTVDAPAFLFSTPLSDILTGTSSDNDTVSYINALAPVTASLLITTQQNTGHGLDTLIDIENLVGGNFNDNLKGDAKDNILNGEAGNDILRGWSGADTMLGGSGNDRYFVENLGDVVIEQFNRGTDYVNSKITYTLPSRP